MESTSSRATATQREQWMVEGQVFRIYELFGSIPRNAQTQLLELQRDNHIEYLTKGLRQLGPSFTVLDANRPWLCYWILHSIALLGDALDDELEDNVIDFLGCCQDVNGGYGGGPGQMPHLATTYAAINSLITLGGDRSLSSINRHNLHTFLLRMKDRNGGFRMHDAGEMDVRACYTAISVASVLNILDYELVKDVGNYILSCQTYEGGIAGEPGSEAHGGYTFCGLATMILIGEVGRLDLHRLVNWVVFRQGVECGLQGRTNKLVDACYSFWQGAVFALLQRVHEINDDKKNHTTSNLFEGEAIKDDSSHLVEYHEIGFNFLEGCAMEEPLFHSMALQQYILLCSQLQEGGFRDKPGKQRDYYHTCYALSGLSVAQYSSSKDFDSPPLHSALFGPYSNLVEPIHPIFNVVLDRYQEAHEFFSGLPH